MLPTVFKEGQKVRVLVLPGSDVSTFKVGEEEVKSITVVMENGQCAGVPWFQVDFDNDQIRSSKWNGAQLLGVQLFDNDNDNDNDNKGEG